MLSSNTHTKPHTCTDKDLVSHHYKNKVSVHPAVWPSHLLIFLTNRASYKTHTPTLTCNLLKWQFNSAVKLTGCSLHVFNYSSSQTHISHRFQLIKETDIQVSIATNYAQLHRLPARQRYPFWKGSDAAHSPKHRMEWVTWSTAANQRTVTHIIGGCFIWKQQRVTPKSERAARRWDCPCVCLELQAP